MIPTLMRVLTWNLFHGRSEPGAGRDLRDEFAALLAGWAWDVALLQEVPPWWPPPLAEATGAHARWVLTSRNSLLPLRRLIAERAPDLIRSNGGGANAMLVRDAAPPSGHVSAVLARRPERRTMHAAQLADGTWVANLHASNRPRGQSRGEGERALGLLRGWAGDSPFVFGGDFNQTRPGFPGLEHAAGHWVDHIFTRGLTAASPAERPDRGRLSDHEPVTVELRRAPSCSGG